MNNILSYCEFTNENLVTDIYEKYIKSFLKGSNEEILINIGRLALMLFGGTTIFWYFINLIRKILKNNKNKILNKNFLNKIGKELPEVRDAILVIESMSRAEKKIISKSIQLMRKDPYIIYLMNELNNPNLEQDEIEKLRNKLENRIMSNLTQDEKMIYRKLLNKKEFNYKRNRKDLKKLYKVDR